MPAVQAGELVEAVGVGGLRLQRRAAGRAGAGVQLHRHPRQAFILRVLEAVAVPIAEEGVADGAAAHVHAGQRAGNQVDAALADAVGVAVVARGDAGRDQRVERQDQAFAGVDDRRHAEDRLRGWT